MKHKLTVLAVVGMALLLSTNFAIAQNTVTVVGGALERCASGQAVAVTLDNSSDVALLGLPLAATGLQQIDGAAAGPDLAGFLTAVGGFPGSAGVLNAVGGCLAAGGPYSIWTLQVTTTDACSGNIEIDTAFFPPAGAVILADCGGGPLPAGGYDFIKGSFTVTNEDPVCGNNPDEVINFQGSIQKTLDASDPNPCDALTFTLIDADGLTGAAINGDQFEYSGSCGDVGVHTVTFEVEDPCGATVQCTFDVTVENNAPVCGTNSNETIYWQDAFATKALDATDADGNPLTFSLVSVAPPFASATPSVSASGDFDLAGIDCDDVGVHTITFEVDDGCDQVQCDFNVTVTQNAPIASDPSDEVINWLENLDVTLNAFDDGCTGVLNWSIVSETPAPTNPGSIVGNTYSFVPDCADVGQIYTIVVEVSDGLATDQAEFDIEVINPAPTITCPADIPVAVLGDLVEANATATDPYDDPLVFSLVSFEHLDDPLRVPHNAPSVAADGSFSWQTESFDNNDEGLWEVTILVDDGCGGTDVCSFTIDVLSFTLCVGASGGPTDSTLRVLNGQEATMYVKVGNGYPLGGLDLLLCYDLTGLTFIDAEAVGNLAAWEYFTYRHNYQSNCGGPCPTGYIRIVSIADLDNGPENHPDEAEFHLEGDIVALNFIVTSDRNFIGQCLNVGFCTLDCGDNTFSSKSGDTLFVPIGSDISCIDNNKYVARDIIHLCTGRICVDEPPDDRGDLNLNGLANEVGDAVLYTNWFINGDVVWDPVWKEVQLLASDVNDDGIILTVADLIYMIRIITGDVQPFPANPKLSPYASSGSVQYQVNDGSMTVSTNTSVELGGGMYVFRYSGISIGEPELSENLAGMTLTASARNGELRVLVTPDYNAASMSRISAGNNEIFSVPVKGAGRIELVETQLSDGNGAVMSTIAGASRIPTSYALNQNYPNPFNAGTVIPFDMKEQGDWTLEIYNVAGQVVKSYNGTSAPGQVSVSWDGADNDGRQAASGVYFYRVSAGEFTATRKMTLLK